MIAIGGVWAGNVSDYFRYGGYKMSKVSLIGPDSQASGRFAEVCVGLW